MYYRLVSALKRRLVVELQDAFARHPVYDKLVPNIQNKYVFEERPQFGIVVKGSSANKVQLSGDNFVGLVHSHVMLAYLNQPAYMLEWVREDVSAVTANGGAMPTAPGVYYFECLAAPTNVNEAGLFAVDPLLSVVDEPVFFFESGIESGAQLQQVPVRGTLRLWENRNHLLLEGKDYEVDYTTGEIQFLTRFYPAATVAGDYFYAAPSIGPVEFKWNSADFNTLPGVVLAFGKRAKLGDKLAVRVYEERVDTAKAYGGKFEVTFDLDVISQDPTQMEEIADFAVMSLWGEKKDRLEYEGIELLEVSMGGEAEEQYDETGDLFFYNASLSVQLRADWEAHIPMPLSIMRATTTSSAADASVDADRRTALGSNLKVLSNGTLYVATSPILAGRNDSYEKIA